MDECAAPLEPDFLSLDTEGYELNVLRGANLDKYRFKYVLIEIYVAQFYDIIAFMESKGYNLHSNVSGYNRVDNPGWDGTHNDFLFVRADL